MFKRKHPILWLLLTLPWWVSCIVSITAFSALWWVVPALAEGNAIFYWIANSLVKPVAPYVGLCFMFIAAADLVRMLLRLQMLDRQTGIEGIKALSWRQFEVLVAEAFKLAGYKVVETGGGGPDGGVDLVLWKDQRKATVQCKQWRSALVGQSVIKEMFGVMLAEGASECFIVTSGGFSEDAIAFANGKNIHLIDGDALVVLVKDANIRRIEIQEKILDEIPLCPEHKAPMVWRLARQGEHAGWHFWGCREYSRCGCERKIDERDWANMLRSKADNPANWRLA